MLHQDPMQNKTLHETLLDLQNTIAGAPLQDAMQKIYGSDPFDYDSHILCNNITVSYDESAMLNLAITFAGEDPCDIAEEAAKFLKNLITEFISQQLANYPDAHIESHEFYAQYLIHGYSYYVPETQTDQISHYASIICSDCTVYITLTIYNQ